MTERSIHCTFHHVSSELVQTISSLTGLRTSAKLKDNQLIYSCTLSNARQIRSNLADLFGQYPFLWFSIDHGNPSNSSSSKSDRNLDQIFFGSLLSNEKFLIHPTPFSPTDRWKIKLHNKQTLILDNSSSISVSIPLRYLHKEILVIDGEDFSEIILSYNFISIDIQKRRMYGNHLLVQSLNQCSDFLISLSPKSVADSFLDELRSTCNAKVFYTTITIQHNAHQWSRNDLNPYRTEQSQYAISMLHSLGYVFDDKYLHNQMLRNQMIELAEQDEKLFYQISLKIYFELKKCHWMDLREIFRKNSFKGNTDDQSIYVAVVHLTPTRFLIMPKEKSKGHRALRHSFFCGANDFCLVYLKPDPPNIYLNENPQLLEYFQELFQTGFQLNGNQFHLFGASNSQVKEHSFWFLKAISLDDIHHKRQLLGEFDRIRNLGTYVARLGLWFSKTDPTDIKLNYCSNEVEFNSRVQQGEICVMMIEDIERNNYCFTDGNGLVSKGLAKLITEKFSHRILPSAYQIRVAGCKGLIILDPQSTVEQFYIKIRPSMKKFQCNDWTLEICDYSRATPTRLNNQFIWLLSDLGVADRTFLRLQQRWFSKKPSVSNCSEDLLKNKIPLPVNECRYLYGCALESKLEEGQCFIRYQILNDSGKSSAQPKFECVRGRVIVTKNPCPYAGDMLELWAVDLPELHHLNDVIVFSTRGERPDFNKIAGSDLDGDGYFIYWGEELRLKCQVQPLDYTPDEKQYQSTSITPNDVIKYCLSTIGATSSGEIYNLHAIIIDKNEENCQQRTCQTLAIELARMFSSAVDSGKTGYVIDKKRIQQIRDKYGKKYPDFLGKDEKRSYRSESIVGKLYRNAKNYINGKTDQLENIFAQLNIKDEDDQLRVPTPRLTIKTNDQPAAKCKLEERPMQLHPGSPLSPAQSSISIPTDTSSMIYNKIPPQYFLIDGMVSSSSSIRFCPSTKPFYSDHNDLTRLRIELASFSSDHFQSSSPSLSSLFFDQLSSFDYSIHNNEISTMIISFGHIYLLKYPEQVFLDKHYPKQLNSLLTNHFLPPLFETFFPSTILERIEITDDNSHYLQQIFSKSNHTIKREYIESNSNSLCLIFPWFKMDFIDHQREIILICHHTQFHTEIRIHFDKNGRIKSIENRPKIFFKCFHQQTSSYRSDILYEFRSHFTLTSPHYSSIFKHQTLLDPTHPLTLPLQESIIPIVSYSIITNVFQYNEIEIHVIRNYAPVHYKNDDFYKFRCTAGYIEEEQHSVEIHVRQNGRFHREKLRYLMALAIELSQMLD